MTRSAGVGALALAVVGGLLVALGLLWPQPSADVRPAATGAEPGAINPAGNGTARVGAADPGRRPTGVVIPALAIDVPVQPIATTGTTLTPPDDPMTLGWWSGGAAVGADRGSVLITGHTVHEGGGALDDLETLHPGERVAVATPRGAVDYVVRRVELLDKAELAARAERLFSTTGSPRLVLVTCEDWDGTGYRSNVVVLADPVPTSE